MIRILSAKTLIPMAIASFVSLAHADVIGTFNFDNDAVGMTTPFTDTSNGISATFTSPADPGAFTIAPSVFQALSGNVLGSAFGGANQLDINFNAQLTAATLVFATSDFGTPQPFELEAFENGNPVGSATATGVVPAGFIFPEGEIAFEGQAFNSIVLSTPNSPGFAIDSVEVAEAPEPGTASLILLGALAAFAPTVLRRVRWSAVWSRISMSSVARTALALGAAAGMSSAAVPSIFPLPAATASTVPGNGDVNPYGVAFVPRSVPAGGALQPNAILVSNFNNNENLQGTGTTIVQIQKDGTQSLFFTASGTQGMTAGLGIFSDGLVLCGTLPSLDGTPATARPGNILVIDRNGNLLGALTNLISGPWGMAIQELGGGNALVFVSNVLNGTIIRMNVVENGEALSVASTTVIASGLTHRPDPAAFELGPSGLTYDATHDVLYIADSADNTIYAVDGAAAATGTLPTATVYQDNVHLHGPLDLALLPTGHLVVADSDGSNADPNQPSELVEFTADGQFVAQYSVDPNNGGAFGVAVLYAGFDTITIAAVDDNQNILRISTETLN